MLHRRTIPAGAAALPLFRILPGRAQSSMSGSISDGVVKIGILNDMTGVRPMPGRSCVASAAR